MSTIAAMRRLNTSGMMRGRRTVATAITGSQQGVPSATAATIRLGWNNNNSKNNRHSLLEINDINSTAFVHRRQLHQSAAVCDYPDHIVVPFPALSPTMEIGTIAKWELSEGDKFTAGSVIASIETDKATMDFEAQDDGILAKILKDGADATDLPVGTPIAIVVEEPEDVAAFADYVAAEDEAPSSSESEVPTPAAEISPSIPVVGGSAGTSLLLPSARFLAESKYVD